MLTILEDSDLHYSVMALEKYAVLIITFTCETKCCWMYHFLFKKSSITVYFCRYFSAPIFYRSFQLKNNDYLTINILLF